MMLHLIAAALPLLLLTAGGAWCARSVSMPPAALGALLIRLINPLLTFGFIASLPLNVEHMLLPPLTFVLANALCLLGRALGQRLLSPQDAGVAALACVSGNTTYFALPIIGVLYPDLHVLGIWLLLNAGLQAAEAGTGVYVAARGRYSARESVLRVLRLPPLYAIGAGIAWQATGLPLPALVLQYRQYAAGAGVVVGMALLGVTLMQDWRLQGGRLQMNKRMNALLLGMRFVVWPTACMLIVAGAAALGHPFDADTATMIVLLGAVPLPVNAVAYAAELRLPTGPIAACVLLSTLIAPFSMPLLLQLNGIV